MTEDTLEDVAGDGMPLDTHLEGIATIAGSSRLRSPILTMGHLGTHVVWSILNARASLFLQRLGLYKSFVAIVLMAGPLSGLLVQPIVGVLSDHCTSRWGRRRPFIFVGLIACCVSLLCLSLASSMSYEEKWKQFRPFVALIGILGIVGVDISVNTLSAAHRALTIDVLGAGEQDIANAWTTRYSSMGSLLGYLLGVLDLPKVFAFMGMSDQLAILSICALVLVVLTHLTLFVLLHESVLVEPQHHARRTVFQSVKGIAVNLIRCGRSLPPHVWDLFVIQFFSWLAWFPVLYYAATWVAEIFSLAHGSSAQTASAKNKMGEEARRAGSLALFYYALTGLVASFVLPWYVYDPVAAKSSAHTRYEPAGQNDTELNNLQEGTTFDEGDEHERIPSPATVPKTPPMTWMQCIRRGPSLAEVWFLSQVAFVITMMIFTCPVFSTKSVTGAIILISVLGILWSITLWVPYALLGILVFSSKPVTSNAGHGTTSLRAETGTITGLHNWSIVLPQLVISVVSSLRTCPKANLSMLTWQCFFCPMCCLIRQRPSRSTARASCFV